jgi:hypothetical protein
MTEPAGAANLATHVIESIDAPDEGFAEAYVKASVGHKSSDA